MPYINRKQKVFVMHVYNDEGDYTTGGVNISSRLKFYCEGLVLQYFDVVKDILCFIDLIHFHCHKVTFIIGKAPFSHHLKISFLRYFFLPRSFEIFNLIDPIAKAFLMQYIENLSIRIPVAEYPLTTDANTIFFIYPFRYYMPHKPPLFYNTI